MRAEPPLEPELVVLGSGLAAASAAAHASARGVSAAVVELSHERVVRSMLALDATPFDGAPLTGSAVDHGLFGPDRLALPRVFTSLEGLGLERRRLMVRDEFEQTVLATGSRVVLAMEADDRGDEMLTPFMRLVGRGISWCAWSDAYSYPGQRVVVFGDADYAGEEALHALRAKCIVEILAPGEFAPQRASVRAALQGRVAVREHVTVDDLLASEGALAAIRFRCAGRRFELATGAFFLALTPRVSPRLREFAEACVADLGTSAVALAGALTGVPAWNHPALILDGARAAAAVIATP